MTALAAAAPVVRTTAGAVRGYRDEGVETFLGVPYAAPPVGALRYRKPQRHPGWEGVRPAVAFGDAPVQPVFDDPSQKRYGVFEDSSEDCLVLNVWTPAADPAARLPVIVFLHGGGYIGGSGAVPVYGGGVHAREGVVWVTVNHRLGGPGFVYLDELFPGLSGTGHLGIWDQVQALEWLRENVAAFGGDPDRIAVAGSSAGALSVAAMLAAPAGQHLFRRGMLLSSRAGHATLDTERATAVARVFLDDIGVAPGDTDALLAVPARRLSLHPRLVFGPMRAAAGQYPLGAVVDGDLLTAPVIEAVRGGAGGHVDVVAGTTTEECRGDVLDEHGEPRPGVVLDPAAHLPPGVDPAAGVELYRRSLAAQGLPGDDAELTIAVASDDVMVQPTLALAAARARAGGAGCTWVYRFAWRSPGAGGRTGAHHGLPNPFLTGNLQLSGWRTWLGGDPPLGTAVAFRRAAQAFAATGDPNHAGLPSWDPYVLPRRPTLWLDEDVAVVDDPQRERRELWAPVYDPSSEELP